jgi:hypothetical protein
MRYAKYGIILLIITISVIACRNRYNYFQNKNSKYLIETNQSIRIFPHRVNSVGKLQDIWNVGFRSFEFDVRFGDNNTDEFRVGHNIGAMGGKLENLFLSIDYNQIQKLWLDFKNLDENNYLNALNRLQFLDDKFGIKQKMIVESGTTSDFFRLFKENGWHTSYYLPTITIKNLLENKDTDNLQKLSKIIAKQSKKQKLSAISFDSSIYPFVKKYLEPLIDQNIVYHTWWGPDLYKSNFQNKLKKDKLYLNPRVKTILVRFKSKHEL